MSNESWLKKNIQFIYSLVLIVLIPSALVANTWLVIRNNQKNADIELQRKAALAEEIFAGAIADSWQDTSALQTKIDQIKKAKLNGLSEVEVSSISVLQPSEGSTFTNIASSDGKQIGTTPDPLQYSIAWAQEQSIAALINQNGQRFWRVITPILDTNGEKQLIVDMSVSLADADQLSQRNFRQSLVVLTVTVLVIILLLINHFRFFEYAVLFRRLKEVDQMKDDFISIASHELKTPLAAVKGYISMVMEGGVAGGKTDEKAKGNLTKAFSNANRLNLLVNDLLDISRLEQGRMKFEFQNIDISPLISQIIGELKVKADEKHLALNYKPPADPKPQIYVDPDRLGQVLDNIIGNAIKYTLKGGVEISHIIEGNNLKTIVKDTGIGMSAEARKQLFTKFYRIKTKETEDIPGTGLGLWITKEIVNKMKGEIFVDSMEGAGSQFTIVFPITKK